MSIPRDHVLYKAKMAHEARRHHDFVEEMKSLAKMAQEFNDQERYLLAVAYKNVINPRLESWLTLTTINQENEHAGATRENQQIVIPYLRKVEDEIKTLCQDALELVDIHLLPKAQTPAAIAYCLKLKGDYYRYLAEVMSGEARADAVSKSAAAYETAADTCIRAALEPLHPSRLAVVLSFADFHHSITKEEQKALDLAGEAFDTALVHASRKGVPQERVDRLMTLVLNENLHLLESENLSTVYSSDT